MNEPIAVQEHRLGVVAVFVENRLDTAPKVNQILSEFGRILVGRMGIPYRERNLSVIAVIVDGSNDDIGALTGKLGAIPGVSVKAALRRKEGNAECKVQDAKCKMEDGGSKLEARGQNAEVRMSDTAELA
jgi:putative iron-only hydrogenase system regulator